MIITLQEAINKIDSFIKEKMIGDNGRQKEIIGDNKKQKKMIGNNRR